jgi:hypothetical protein
MCFPYEIIKVLQTDGEDSWTDRVRGEEVLRRFKEERYILHAIKRREDNLMGHLLRRNCPLKRVIEGNIEVRIEMKGRRGRRRQQLLDDIKETNRCWKWKERVLDRTLWRTGIGRGY